MYILNKDMRILKRIKCLFGFHNWKQHIEFDYILMCIECFKTKANK